MKTVFRTAISSLLIAALLFTPVVPTVAKSRGIPVALLEIDYVGLPDHVQSRMNDRLTELFTSENSFEVQRSNDISQRVTGSRLDQISKKPDLEALASLAKELNVQHIYGGYISNNSRDSKRVLLVGELWRYDRATNLRHSFEILKYYEHIGVEILRFNKEFVKTVLTERNQSGPKILPYIVLLGVAVVGVAAFAVVSSEGGASSGGGQNPAPPLTN